jgi:hypothetical protein
MLFIKHIDASSLLSEDNEHTILADGKYKLGKEQIIIDSDKSLKEVETTSEKIVEPQGFIIAAEAKSPVTDSEFSKDSTPGTVDSTFSDVDNHVFSTPKSHISRFPIFRTPDDAEDSEIESDSLKLPNISELISNISLLESEPNLKLSATVSIREEEDVSSAFEKMRIKPKKYNKRLILGEADFSYTVSLIKKHAALHPEFAKAIIATELSSMKTLQTKYPDTFIKNINYLHSRDARVLYGVDATQIHSRFQGERIKRIHFNFPHDGSNYKDHTLSKIISDFFSSASQLQKKGDRIYIALPYIKHDEWREKSSLGNNYDIYKASILAGYQLFRKRGFKERDRFRYDGYQHRETNSNVSALDAILYCREYIFEYMGPSTQELIATILIKSPPRIHKVAKKYIRRTSSEEKEDLYVLPFLATDDESSAYENENTDGERDTLT